MAIFMCPSPIHKGMCVSLALFDNVDNCKELKDMVMEGKLSVALIKPTLILEKFQALVAGTQAIHHELNNCRVTKLLQTELLYCLSPNKNISDAFRKFGMADTDRSVLVCEIHRTGESQMALVQENVKGTLVDINKLKEMANEAQIKKVYKIQEPEQQVGTLLEAIVCRIASKDFAS